MNLMLQSKGYYCLFRLRIWSVVSSNWVTNWFRWLLTLILYLFLNLDISSLTVGILRSRCVVSLVTNQGASIKNLRVFDWNHSLLPTVGSHRSKQVLIWLYITLFYSACLSWSVCQWVSRIFLVLFSVL